MGDDERGEPSSPHETRVGQTLGGRWRVDRLIDVGGMATVYEATHRNGRRSALKVLHSRFARDAEVRRRFLREGYVANRIDHPGAVAILDDDVTEDGAPFLVMELLLGESLSGWLARSGGRLPVGEVLAIGEQVLEVLAAAHENGIVHRDIKPGNIFVTRTGHAKLLDFGLARIRDGAISLVPTAAGLVLGTAGYMAPEQARGNPEEIDARADVFAVGAVLFRALAGRPVHEKRTPIDTILAAMREPAPSLREAMPGAGPALVAVVDRALAFERRDRFSTAAEMREALRTAYAEARRPLPPPLPMARRAGAGSVVDESVALELVEAPSLVVDVAFGTDRDAAIARERQRTHEVIDAMSARRGLAKE
jgi:serine/threonine protein kinase